MNDKLKGISSEQPICYYSRLLQRPFDELNDLVEAEAKFMKQKEYSQLPPSQEDVKKAEKAKETKVAELEKEIQGTLDLIDKQEDELAKHYEHLKDLLKEFYERADYSSEPDACEAFVKEGMLGLLLSLFL